MHIGLNLLFFRPGVIGGTEVSVRELVKGLDASGRHDLVIFTTGAGARAFDGTRRTRTVVFGSGGYSGTVRAVGELAWLRGAVRRSGVEVLLHPGGYALAPLLGIPQVAAVNDLQHLWFPENFSRGRRLARSLLYRVTARTASHFTAISEFTRSDLVSRLGIDPGRVAAVPLGADPIVVPEPAAIAAARRRRGLPDVYFHYPAMVAPHKNHRVLLEALALLRRRRPEVHLLLTGKFTGDGRLDDALRSLGLEGVVHGLGFVPRDEALALLAGARALVFPSRFEGFGLPLVEAMGCRVPVLASRVGSIPEVVGDAGLLLSDSDPREWADAMERILVDPGLRERLVEVGARNVTGYTWQRSVAGTEAVLEQARAADATRRGG
jgi:glycosyltransferase involved in cell wall biosynthesis